MVRTAGGARPTWSRGYSDEEEQDDSEEDPVSDVEYSPKKKLASKKSPKKKPKSPRGKISPSKTPASKRKFAPVNDDDDDEEDLIDDDDEDERPAPKKRKSATPASKKRTPARASHSMNSSRLSTRTKASVKYIEEPDDNFEESDDYEETPKRNRNKAPVTDSASKRSAGRPRKTYKDDSESDVVELSSNEDEDEGYRQSKTAKRTKSSPVKYQQRSPVKPLKVPPRRATPKEDNFPAVSEMVQDSIRALNDPPKKGSTLRLIKETIALNWPVNMRIYDVKIKKYITKALGTGEIIQTKGKGFSGRFTIPALKTKKKKKSKNTLSKKFDEDEVEYEPKKTQRDEEREKDLEELERRRLERALQEERIKAERAAERAKRPKKKKVIRDTWEVEAIKGKKERDGDLHYLVKFVGYPKLYWEPEKNVQGCQELIDAFEKKEVEMEEMRRRAEQDGEWEVQKILEVKFRSDKTREFLIRWKGFGANQDSWEPEENLSCEDLIESFMKKWESIVASSEKSLRIAPKKVKRLAFSASARVSKRNNGFRVTYEDMDE